MKTIIVALSITLVGCAAPQTYAPAAARTPMQQAKIECEYEASKTSDAIRNGFEAGFVKATLTRKCMSAKGYEQQ